MSLRFALAAVALLGCQDPYDVERCYNDNVLAPSGACVAPELSPKIDGVADDWRGMMLVDTEAPGLQGTHVAREGSRTLVFHLQTGSAAPSGKQAQFAIYAYGKGRVVEFLFGRDVPGSYYAAVDGEALVEVAQSAPGEYAYTDDGVEARIPIEFFPFDGEANFGFAFAKVDAKGELVTDRLGYPRPVCWDARHPQNICSF